MMDTEINSATVGGRIGKSRFSYSFVQQAVAELGASSFPNISCVFSKNLRGSANLRLIDAIAFPTIGTNGPQVCGITVNGSSAPLLLFLFHFAKFRFTQLVV